MESEERLTPAKAPGGAELLIDLTAGQYNEMRTLDKEKKQETSEGVDQITIDKDGMVRADGEELIKLVEPDKEADTTDCMEEAEIIDVIIGQIEQNGEELIIIDEFKQDEASEGGEEALPPPLGVHTPNTPGGTEPQPQNVVIYLNSAVKSKRQIQVNKCERCDLHFGSRVLLYKHYSAVHLRAPTPTRPKGRPRKDPLGVDEEFVDDPGAMVETLGPKKFSCRKCGRLFKRSFDVVRHFDCVHNGVSSPGGFSCPHCSRTFARKDNLQRHERTHDSNRTLFSCETCHKLFTRKFDTLRHYEIVHKKLPS